MNPKPLVMIGLVIGSTVGSYIPSLWGAGFLSMSSILGSLIGGLIGIWAGYQVAQRM